MLEKDSPNGKCFIVSNKPVISMDHLFTQALLEVLFSKYTSYNICGRFKWRRQIGNCKRWISCYLGCKYHFCFQLWNMFTFFLQSHPLFHELSTLFKCLKLWDFFDSLTKNDYWFSSFLIGGWVRRCCCSCLCEQAGDSHYWFIFLIFFKCFRSVVNG